MRGGERPAAQTVSEVSMYQNILVPEILSQMSC